MPSGGEIVETCSWSSHGALESSSVSSDGGSSVIKCNFYTRDGRCLNGGGEGCKLNELREIQSRGGSVVRGSDWD